MSLLEQIGRHDKIIHKTSGAGGNKAEFRLEDIKPLENIVRLKRENVGKQIVVIPLDRVLSVWRDDAWRLSLDGSVDEASNLFVPGTPR